jgi:hypothetical protein
VVRARECDVFNNKDHQTMTTTTFETIAIDCLATAIGGTARSTQPAPSTESTPPTPSTSSETSPTMSGCAGGQCQISDSFGGVKQRVDEVRLRVRSLRDSLRAGDRADQGMMMG